MKFNLRIASLLVIIGIFGFSSTVLAQKAEKYNLVKVKSIKVSPTTIGVINSNKMKNAFRAKKSGNTLLAAKNYSIYKVEGFNSAYVVMKSNKTKIPNFQPFEIKRFEIGEGAIVTLICQCTSDNDDCVIKERADGTYYCNSEKAACICEMSSEMTVQPIR